MDIAGVIGVVLVSATIVGLWLLFWRTPRGSALRVAGSTAAQDWIAERRDPSRPKMPSLPPKPRAPREPDRPWRGEPILVRSYNAQGVNSTKKMTEAYQSDARTLAMQGYEPVSTAGQGANPANIFMGGIGLLASGTLTVTYKLTAEARAKQQQQLARYPAQLANYEADTKQFEAAMPEWDSNARAVRAEHRRFLALWRAEWSERRQLSRSHQGRMIRDEFTAGSFEEAEERLSREIAQREEEGIQLLDSEWVDRQAGGTMRTIWGPVEPSELR